MVFPAGHEIGDATRRLIGLDPVERAGGWARRRPQPAATTTALQAIAVPVDVLTGERSRRAPLEGP